MIRGLLALVLVLHGLVHVLGFVVPWRLATVATMPYTTTLLAGRLDVGATGIRVVGVLWLLAAVGLVIAGTGVMTAQGWWLPLTLVVVLGSVILTILGSPASYFGVIVNVVLLAYLILGSSIGSLALPR